MTTIKDSFSIEKFSVKQKFFDLVRFYPNGCHLYVHDSDLSLYDDDILPYLLKARPGSCFTLVYYVGIGVGNDVCRNTFSVLVDEHKWHQISDFLAYHLGSLRR